MLEMDPGRAFSLQEKWEKKREDITSGDQLARSLGSTQQDLSSTPRGDSRSLFGIATYVEHITSANSANILLVSSPALASTRAKHTLATTPIVNIKM
ncbi:hypothetical protein SK128_021609 [Halocaridina rubra]|uniref:Uncharacterized protein n=1 Tax=Halocaridina rubra TaxID=373956 RepID=A0AAN8WLK8_HALRR